MGNNLLPNLCLHRRRCDEYFKVHTSFLSEMELVPFNMYRSRSIKVTVDKRRCSYFPFVTVRMRKVLSLNK